MTVSSTLSDEKTRPIIFASMLSMGFFTIMYESGRKCWVSFMSILLLLVGIYGVILIEENEPIHYVFAFMAFISILMFMFRNRTNNKYDLFLCSTNTILFFLLILSILFGQENTSTIGIFGYEIGFLICFTIFYFTLHFRSFSI